MTVKEEATQSGLTVGRMGDDGELLDAQAKTAYKRRIAELHEPLEEAHELNQLELVDQLKDEIETLGRELSRAVGLGGRDRGAASSSERARINVTRDQDSHRKDRRASRAGNPLHQQHANRKVLQLHPGF